MMTTISCLGKDKISKVRTRTIHARIRDSHMYLHSINKHSLTFIAVLENGGFTYHSNRVPSVSRVMINPVQDSDLSVELSLVAYNLKICPSTVVRNNKE